MTDRERLLQTLAAVYAFYDREVSEMALAFWLDDLAGHDVQAIERAFAAHRRDPQRGQWLPKPADILRHLQPAEADRAQLAWGQVLESARHAGWGVEKVEPAGRKALDAVGGMRALRMADAQQAGHMQRQFLAAFAAYSHREAMDAVLLGRSTQERLQ